jgi:hypothetical protein
MMLSTRTRPFRLAGLPRMRSRHDAISSSVIASR